jgi:type IV/VI secretion system ImpK/VasF family protein
MGIATVSGEKPSSLIEACSPFFLYLTTFRRNAASSEQDVQSLRAALNHELDKVHARCEGNLALETLYEKARYPLVVAADQVVLTSPWAHRAGWSMQLFESQLFGSLQGGKKFFEIMDQVLADPTEDGVQMAEMLFHCMAIGFQGELRGNKEELTRRRRQLFEKARLPDKVGDSLAPDAYGRNSAKSTLVLPTVGILRFVAVAIAVIVFTLLLGNAITHLTNDKLITQIDEQVDALSGKEAE